MSVTPHSHCGDSVGCTTMIPSPWSLKPQWQECHLVVQGSPCYPRQSSSDTCKGSVKWRYTNVGKNHHVLECPVRNTFQPRANQLSIRTSHFSSIKSALVPWLVWLSRLSTSLRTKRPLVRFLVRAHAWVAGQVPGWGVQEATNPCVSLAH